MAIDLEGTDPWARLPGEPSHWYTRFNHYRLLGPKRSVNKTFAELGASKGTKRHPDGNWHEAVVRYRWYERAAAWDMALARADAEADAQERKEAREQRRRLAKLAFSKLAIALNGLTEERLQEMSPFAVFLSIRTILREVRAEFDDLPTTHLQLAGPTGGPVQISLDLTPPVEHIGGNGGNGHIDFDPDDLQDDDGLALDPMPPDPEF